MPHLRQGLGLQNEKILLVKVLVSSQEVFLKKVFKGKKKETKLEGKVIQETLFLLQEEMPPLRQSLENYEKFILQNEKFCLYKVVESPNFLKKVKVLKKIQEILQYQENLQKTYLEGKLIQETLFLVFEEMPPLRQKLERN